MWKKNVANYSILVKPEIKMPRNAVFRLNCEIKMLKNSKIVKNPAKLKCWGNFMPRKFLFMIYMELHLLNNSASVNQNNLGIFNLIETYKYQRCIQRSSIKDGALNENSFDWILNTSFSLLMAYIQNSWETSSILKIFPVVCVVDLV